MSFFKFHYNESITKVTFISVEVTFMNIKVRFISAKGDPLMPVIGGKLHRNALYTDKTFFSEY